MICELLGLPLGDRPMFMRWADGMTASRNTLGLLFRMMRGIGAIRRYLEAHIETVRRRVVGLIAELVRVEKEGHRLSRDEMVAMVFLLLFARTRRRRT